MSTEVLLNRKQIEEILRDVLRKVQEYMDEPTCKIEDDTRPVGDLGGFDSLCAVDATTELADRLEIEKIDSTLFFSKENGKPLTFKAIVDRLSQILKL